MENGDDEGEEDDQGLGGPVHCADPTLRYRHRGDDGSSFFILLKVSSTISRFENSGMSESTVTCSSDSGAAACRCLLMLSRRRWLQMLEEAMAKPTGTSI